MSRHWSRADEREYQERLTRMTELLKRATYEEAYIPQYRPPPTQRTRTQTSQHIYTDVYPDGVEEITVRNTTSRQSRGYGSSTRNPTKRTGPSVSFRGPSSGHRRPNDTSHTGTAQHAAHAQRSEPAYYVKTVHPPEAGHSAAYREPRTDNRTYQSTSRRAAPEPQFPRQQTSKHHHQRGRRRTRAPEPVSPPVERSLSVIQPASISEPPTVIDVPIPRARNVVKMLPTPPGSEFTKAPPPSTRPTTACKTDYGTSSKSPFVPPVSRRAAATQPMSTLLTEDALRSANPTIESRPQRPRRGGPLPSIFNQAQDPEAAWDIYHNTSASEYHGNREGPVPSQSKQSLNPSQTTRTAETASPKTNSGQNVVHL